MTTITFLTCTLTVAVAAGMAITKAIEAWTIFLHHIISLGDCHRREFRTFEEGVASRT